MATKRSARERGARAALLVERGGQAILRYPLTGRGARIGSHAGNDLSLPVAGIPDFLGEVVAAPRRGHIAVACKSRRLTVNGRESRRHLLQDGDLIDLGPLQARYLSAGESPSPVVIGTTGQITVSSDGNRLSIAEGHLLYEEDGKTLRLPVSVAGVRVGKSPDNELTLNDRSVSGFHALIFARGDRYFVRDLESTNGTVVNNLKIVEAELPLGAEIKFGRALVRFEGRTTESDLSPTGENRLDDIVSAAPNMGRVFSLINRVAGHDVPVCIKGETGTGKELVARALHRRSTRATGPFVAINASAIPENLVEDELFGHEKGAFSGADKLRPGAFEQAQKGTLFLDEIGELPLSVQPKLLRALETFQIRRLGGRDSIDLDIRIVCATHRNLVQLAQQGRFREDLLHRIYVLPIELPPLRQRSGDIELLSRHFMTTVDPSGVPRALSKDALEKLESHAWPGNVRELRNVLVRAALLCDRDPIGDEYIVFTTATLDERVAKEQAYKPLQRLDEIERRTIREVLESVGGNRSHAAQLLGISRSTLIRKMKDLQLSDMPSTRKPRG